MNNFYFETGNGLVLSTQNFWNGNVISASAQAVLLDDSKGDALKQGIRDLEFENGALSRHADRLQNTSVDDYIAAACIPEFATRILRRMRTHFGFCDVIDSTMSLNFKQFMLRFLGFYAHCKLSAGESLSWFWQMAWAKSIENAAVQPFSNQDGWIQSHLMIMVYSRAPFRAKRLDAAVRFWVPKKIYPTSKIMEDYLGPDGLDHPLIGLWIGRG